MELNRNKMKMDNKIIETDRFRIHVLNQNLEPLIKDYYICDEFGKHEKKQAEILDEYGYKQPDLYEAIDNYSEAYIRYLNNCLSCGGEVTRRIERRQDIIKHYKKDYELCMDCWLEKLHKEEIEKQEQKRIEREKEQALKEQLYEEHKTKTLEVIKRLNPFQLKLLVQMYQIRDFDEIKRDIDIFPVDESKHKAVWRTLYNFNRLNLIVVEKNYNQSYIVDILFYESVKEVLKDNEEYLDKLQNKVDVAAKLELQKGGKMVIKLPYDVVLKANEKYVLSSKLSEDEEWMLSIKNYEFDLDEQLARIEKNINNQEGLKDNKFSYDNSDFGDVPF